jgi:hypothetical protein
MQESVQEWCASQGMTFERELKPDVSYVASGGPRGQQVVVVVDPIDPARRPGKPKGKAAGKAMKELERMEQMFMVMKDYRFFRLCLPGVYGMGRYGEVFDWVMLKYYEGERVDETTGELSASLAVEGAMMVFDLTQVPVLKFHKTVATEHYPNRVIELHPCMTLLVEHGVMSAERVETIVAEWNTFFERKVPTLYTVQNGDFRPHNWLRLTEATVLLDWKEARITTLEDVVAHCWISMWRQPEWQERFVREVTYLIDLNPEWLAVMKQWHAVQRACEALELHTLEDREREYLQNIIE